MIGEQVAQYIGETCRYLLAAAPSAEERSHKIRLMFGNGLRPQIWEEFVRRFQIPNIAEFYGSTEGNANISKIEIQQGYLLSRVMLLCYYDSALF